MNEGGEKNNLIKETIRPMEGLESKPPSVKKCRGGARGGKIESQMKQRKSGNLSSQGQKKKGDQKAKRRGQWELGISQ